MNLKNLNGIRNYKSGFFYLLFPKMSMGKRLFRSKICKNDIAAECSINL